MDINKTINKIKERLLFNNYIEKQPFPLFINDKVPPFFTFSPFLVAEKEFEENKNASFFVNQQCFRYCDPDMIGNSPLSLPLQNLIGFYKTYSVEIESILQNLKDLFDNMALNFENIYVVVNEDHPDIINLTKKEFPNVIPFVREDMLAKNIPLTQDAYYMRFVYHYKGGVIGLANIILLERVDNFAKIDGIIFTERIHFIVNNVNTIYETDLYLNSMKMLESHKLKNNNNSYVLISNLKAAMTLYSDRCNINGKKSGHNLKRLIKDAANACILTSLSFGNDELSEILEMIKMDVTNYENINITEIKNMFIEHINRSEKLTKSFIDMYKDEDVVTINEKLVEWKATYGLSDRVLTAYLPKYVRDEMIVGAGGELHNGFWGYIFGENKIDDPVKFYNKKAEEVRSKR